MVDQKKIHNQCISGNPNERRHALEKLENFFSSMPDKQQALNDLIRLTNDEDSDVRSRASAALGSAFSDVPDKQRAWNDLISLTNDEYSEVRNMAAHALGSAFSHVPDKEQAWNDLHRLTKDEFSAVRSSAVYALGFVFSEVPNKQQAWNDLHRLTNDKDRSVRSSAAQALVSLFSEVSNKQQAWNDLQRLINDEYIYVRNIAAEALGSAFSEVQDKEKAWNDLHRLTNNKFSYVRFNAADVLASCFSEVPDKQQAWNDLIRLTNDEDCEVRSRAADTLVSLFSEMPDKQQAWNDLLRNKVSFLRESAAQTLVSLLSEVPDKQQAWNDLIRLTKDEDSDMRSSVADALGSAFSHVPDKQQAWNDLIRLTKDEDSDVGSRAAEVLGSAFSHVPDKEQAWNDLQRLTKDEDNAVKSNAVYAVGSAFSHIPDKKQAWNDLHGLTYDTDRSVRSSAANAVGSAFSQVPDKQLAWNDLHRLTNDEDSSVRSTAASVIGFSYSHMPDKQQAWDDLHRLINDKDRSVRSSAADALGSAFSHVPDKEQAWNDLHRLTNNKDWSVRYIAAEVLGSAFSHIPDKKQAWNDLHGLTYDTDRSVRSSAADALGSAFSHVPDKEQAWNDLHRLTNNKDWSVRNRAAYALGSAFSHIPDKEQAWNDLHRLTNDEYIDVRTSSNHSLGRVSIFKASQAETDEDYKKELEKAIKFFEIAAQESPDELSNPSQFCLPFYRSLHTIIFKRREAKKEVDKYLEEAKAAIECSKSKELLFEAVENLAKALKEVQNIGDMDLEAKKGELKFYRKYCERAAEIIRDIETNAPFATKTIIKGLPILDRNLKKLIEEIREKAKTACQVSQGTATKEIACDVNREIQEWEIGSPEEMKQKVENIAFILTAKIPDYPQNKPILEKIEKMKTERNIVKQYELLAAIIVSIPMTYITVNITDNKDTSVSIGSINQSHEVTKNSIAPNNEQTKSLIGIVTALPKEYAAVKAVFENLGKNINFPGPGAGRRYRLVEINNLNGNILSLVLANADMGTNLAATHATLLLEKFPDLKYTIMVGIAGGVPNPKKVDDHVRLGDIVVSNEKGVIQYDFIKKENRKSPEHRHPPRPPSAKLLELARLLEADSISGNKPWIKYIDIGLSSLGIQRPPEDSDNLYKYYSSGRKKITHPQDPKRIKGKPRVFIGPIGSANILQKDSNMRDKLRDDFGIKAIEMEGSGIADAAWNHEAGYLVVRGICDYCDSHKNDDWQQYAAVVAAAYMRALIESMP